jgi:DNA-binding NarL/FixJ family response regulator
MTKVGGMKKRIRVQVVENACLYDAALRSLISEYDGFEVVGPAECKTGCRQSCASEAPDIIVMELSANGAKSIDCIRQVLARHPDVNILGICPLCDPTSCHLTLNAGATGFISKHAPPGMLAEAIIEVAQGKLFIEPNVAQRMMESEPKLDNPFATLSRREHAVLQLVLAGNSNREIAERLGVSINTVGNHRSHIRNKVGVGNTVELVRMAIRHGILDE